MSKDQTILIVDDEQRNIKLLKALLLPEGYSLHEAMSGEDALEKLKHISPDIILLDVMMPGMDGYEVCKRIKEDEATRIIPVLMVTALNEKRDRVNAMDSGADDFLSKPVDKTELLLRVKSLLRIKSYHDDLLKSYKEIAGKNEQLSRLEKMKEDLTHMIIHDLNTPLTAISGTLELVLMEKEKLAEQQEKWLSKCFHRCNDLEHLIQNILDVNRMEEDKLEAVKEPTNLYELAESVLSVFLRKIENNSIELTLIKETDCPQIEIDPYLIKRVIANLLDNAIRYTPEKGTIKMSIHSPEDNQDICVSITNSGESIPSEFHEKIFNKYEQVNMKAVGALSGKSGLGLVFCKMAVEAHDGKIWIDNNGDDKGTTFSFTLPVNNRAKNKEASHGKQNYSRN